MTIRSATEADVPRMIEVFRRAFLSAFGFTAPVCPSPAMDPPASRGAKLPVTMGGDVCAGADGDIAGLVQPTMDEVDGLWVHPDFQRPWDRHPLLHQGEQVIRERGSTEAGSPARPSTPAHSSSTGAADTGCSGAAWKLHECGIDEESFAMERMLTVSA